MQYLDWCLEHFNELQESLVCQAQSARITVGIRVILRKLFKLADIDLANQAGDILIIFISGLRLGNADLAEDGRMKFDHLEFGDVAVVLVKPLYGPRRHNLA